MIFEFAVSPELFADWQDVRFLVASFGREEGRLVSEIPRKKWKMLVLQAIKRSDNGEVMKKRLKEAATRLIKRALYTRQTAPEVDATDWLAAALAAHEQRPFRAIIVDTYDGDRDDVLACDLSLIDHPLWRVPKDESVERNAATMLGVIQSILDCAGEVVLVDRNFRPDQQRFRNVLIRLMESLSTRPHGPRIGKIVYHVGDDIEIGHLETQCRACIAVRIPASITLEIVVHPRDKLHDRFVLTDIGGVSFGQGLDESLGSGPDKVLVSRLSETTYKEWWRKCKSTTVSFRIVSP
ncbi:hypothetical protein DSCW_57010 [Desulfosarcina widdelii]|uniref:Uncharacterized protein n=1 Tax=Desulfosarcina widdelii TaxID=947919 RepID=A0A5K7ZJ33_9BACT|nr:hypothetical protein [Desulfosarcina widdelii]BBO78284.1 hypothetical protein DSCW_57010 [Desulfosarcina widdelii]